MANKINYTANDRAIVDALRGVEGGLTLAQIKEATGLDIKPGSITSACKKGLIAKVGTVEVEKPTTRSVSTYNFVTGDVLMNAEGKPFNYTDGEKAILAAAANMENPFTLAQLAVAMGVEKIGSGSTNGLLRKGNFSKGEPVDVPAVSKAEVGVYAYVKDVPADAE